MAWMTPDPGAARLSGTTTNQQMRFIATYAAWTVRVCWLLKPAMESTRKQATPPIQATADVTWVVKASFRVPDVIRTIGVLLSGCDDRTGYSPARRGAAAQ